MGGFHVYSWYIGYVPTYCCSIGLISAVLLWHCRDMLQGEREKRVSGTSDGWLAWDCIKYKVPLREVSPFLPGVTQVEWD